MRKALAGNITYVVVAHPSVPAKSMKELIAYAMGAEIVGSTPQDYGAFIQAEINKWGAVVRTAGIKVE